MMTRTTATKLFLSMKELHDLHIDMRSTAMRLFIRPDATANDVMRTQQSLMKAFASYRELYARTRQATENYLDHRYDWNRLGL